MLKLKHDANDYLLELGKFFAKAPGPKMRSCPGFNPAITRLDWGLGHSWWMRFLDDDYDMVVYVTNHIDNTGISTVSLHTKTTGSYIQCRFDLVRDLEDRVTMPADFLGFIQDHEELQLDAFAQDMHETSLAKMRDSKFPKIVLDEQTQKPKPHRSREPEWFSPEDDSEPADMYGDRRTSVSMQYASPENQERDYVVLVYRVSDNKGRNDVYVISVRARSMLLRNLWLDYRRGFHGKFLHLIATASKEQNGLSHLLTFQKLNRTKIQAVCITQPSAGAVVDTCFRPGIVYDVYGFNENIGKDEFVVLKDDEGTEKERHIQHFVVYGR